MTPGYFYLFIYLLGCGLFNDVLSSLDYIALQSMSYTYYLFIYMAHIFLSLSLFLSLSMYSYCCLCILRRGYPD